MMFDPNEEEIEEFALQETTQTALDPNDLSNGFHDPQNPPSNQFYQGAYKIGDQNVRPR